MALHMGSTILLNQALLLEAAKLAYRKHHLGDESIGWDQLSDVLQTTLAEVMGDRPFQAWLAAFSQEMKHHDTP